MRSMWTSLQFNGNALKQLLPSVLKQKVGRHKYKKLVRQNDATQN